MTERIDVGGLRLNADWWSIDRTNLLGQRSTAQINESDTALLRACTQQQIAAGVPVNQIDLGSGAPNYKGDQDASLSGPAPRRYGAGFGVGLPQ